MFKSSAIVSLLVLSVIPFSAFANVVSSSVPALNGKSCMAYLHLPPGTISKALPLVWGQGGSGIYSNSQQDEVPFGLQLLVNQGQVAVLTLDKPGIIPTPTQENPEAAEIDASVYKQYTMDDLIECASHALNWAISQPEISLSSGLIFAGHSEGAIVTVRSYLKITQENPTLAKSIKAVLLSGAPLNPMKDVVTYQINQESKQVQKDFWTAYQNQDNTYLLKPENGGVGYAWLENAFAQKPLQQALDDLANLKANARFEFYQGLQDENVQASFLQAYEQVNSSRQAKNSPSLKLDAHYYAADHDLNLAAYTDMLGFFQVCMNPALPFCQ